MSETVRNSDTHRLGGVVYKMATVSSDFRAAHELLRSEGMEDIALTTPTVLAYKDGELVAFFGTQPRSDMILAGPMVIKVGRPRRFTALRLMEAYDKLLRSIGISTYTTFIGREDSSSLAIMSKLPNTDWIAENFDGVLFARRL